MIILLFVCGYIVVVTFFIGLGTYKLFKKFVRIVPRTVVVTRVETKTITQREIRKQIKEQKMLRDNSYDAVYSRCLELSDSSEVTYFSLEDINRIVGELKKEQMK